MATITIDFPLINQRVITVPDSRLSEFGTYFGVRQEAYKTNAEAVSAFADIIESMIKMPVISARRISSPEPDLSDLVTVS
jgi:hypothetical protein